MEIKLFDDSVEKFIESLEKPTTAKYYAQSTFWKHLAFTSECLTAGESRRIFMTWIYQKITGNSCERTAKRAPKSKEA